MRGRGGEGAKKKKESEIRMTDWLNEIATSHRTFLAMTFLYKTSPIKGEVEDEGEN